MMANAPIKCLCVAYALVLPCIAVSVQIIKPEPIFEAAAVSVSPHIIQLSRAPSNLSYNRLALLAEANGTPWQPHNVALTYEESQYIGSIKIGNQTFNSLVDTGSSDTWVVSPQFKCNHYLGGSVFHSPRSTCEIQSYYTPDSTYHQTPDRIFSAGYGSGGPGAIAGDIATEVMEFGGVRIANQTFGLAHQVDPNVFQGFNEYSGILGLAYRALTSSYVGNYSAKATPGAHKPYSPIFETLYTKSGLPPVFSLTLTSGTNTSQLTLGGVPPSYWGKDFAETAIEYAVINNGTDKAFYWYTVHPKAFIINGKSYPAAGTGNSTQTVPYDQYIVDNGTPFELYPDSVYKAILAGFKPPVKKAYAFSCASVPPTVAIEFDDGKSVHLLSENYVYSYAAGKTTKCGLQINSVSELPTGFGVFGSTFLRGVDAVYDVGNVMMRFADR